MIFESFPWKQDLRRRKNLIIKYNTAEHFEKNDDTTYTVIEKAIFYSAFIIRKLIDCGGKLSDESENYSLKVCSLIGSIDGQRKIVMTGKTRKKL